MSSSASSSSSSSSSSSPSMPTTAQPRVNLANPVPPPDYILTHNREVGRVLNKSRAIRHANTPHTDAVNTAVDIANAAYAVDHERVHPTNSILQNQYLSGEGIAPWLVWAGDEGDDAVDDATYWGRLYEERSKRWRGSNGGTGGAGSGHGGGGGGGGRRSSTATSSSSTQRRNSRAAKMSAAGTQTQLQIGPPARHTELLLASLSMDGTPITSSLSKRRRRKPPLPKVVPSRTFAAHDLRQTEQQQTHYDPYPPQKSGAHATRRSQSRDGGGVRRRRRTAAGAAGGAGGLLAEATYPIVAPAFTPAATTTTLEPLTQRYLDAVVARELGEPTAAELEQMGDVIATQHMPEVMRLADKAWHAYVKEETVSLAPEWDFGSMVAETTTRAERHVRVKQLIAQRVATMQRDLVAHELRRWKQARTREITQREQERRAELHRGIAYELQMQEYQTQLQQQTVQQQYEQQKIFATLEGQQKRLINQQYRQQEQQDRQQCRLEHQLKLQEQAQEQLLDQQEQHARQHQTQMQLQHTERRLEGEARALRLEHQQMAFEQLLKMQSQLQTAARTQQEQQDALLQQRQRIFAQERERVTQVVSSSVNAFDAQMSLHARVLADAKRQSDSLSKAQETLKRQQAEQQRLKLELAKLRN